MAADSAYAVVQRSEKIKVEIFKAYIGAAYLQHDLDVVTAWFRAIVPKSLENARAEDELKNGMERVKLGDPEQVTTLTTPPTSPPRRPPTSPSSQSAASTAPSGSGGSQLFNEICAQKRWQPDWSEERGGEDHRPVFKVVVSLNREYLWFLLGSLDD
jgi:hypothetical protein